ncbi:MAG TPA: outer membrane beta-barrel protein [Vicinamibacterales bacterium]
MKRLLVALSGAWLLAGIPSTASADVLLTPFAGVTFIDEGDLRKFNYGASLGFGGLIGLEFDVSQTQLGSFDDIPIVRLDADVTTVMGNLVVRVPAGPVQPYASGGVGIIRVSGDVEVPFVGSLIGASATDFAWNLGGGIYLFPTEHFGIRGDVRYFRTADDLDIDDFTDIDGLDDLPLPNVDFWRITGGVTFRF